MTEKYYVRRTERNAWCFFFSAVVDEQAKWSHALKIFHKGYYATYIYDESIYEITKCIPNNDYSEHVIAYTNF